MHLKKVLFRRPLAEGEVPPDYVMGADGQLYERILDPEDYTDTDPFEGKIPETSTYYLGGKEEYWGFETVCKSCGTRFMAYKDYGYGYDVRNYCPGCGKRLVPQKAGDPDGEQGSETGIDSVQRVEEQ